MEVKETAKTYERYTYADYARWDDEGRYELIDGAVYMMASPSQAHQEVLVELCGQFRGILKDKPCKVFVAPFDVCLNGAGDEDDTVVQPDILVVCDKSKLDGKRCNGAPDMVAEILSPSTSGRDRFIKFNKYLQAGVREYWIVDPTDKIVTVYILKDGEYFSRVYGSADEGSTAEAPVNVAEGCKINIKELFGEEI